MSFSYSGDPTMSPLDEVRFLCGDTNPDTAQLQDEEVNYLLSTTANNRYAAAAAAETIAARYAGMTNMSIDGLSISYGDVQRHYIALADQLRSGAPITAMPYAGGISRSDKENNLSDDDATRTTVYRRMHMEQALPTIPDDDLIEPVQGSTNR